MDDLTCEEFERDVGAWLDEDATPETRTMMEAHTARCATCAALLADLRRIATDARALPALAPTRDLWAGIEARIQAPVIPLADGASVAGTAGSAPARRAPRTWQLSTRGLAAAAAVLIAISSGLTYLATRSEPAVTRQWVATGGESVVHPAGMPVPAITQYDAEIGRLRDVIAERRGELDSATVATIERSLRVIDDAIAESRAALAHDPASDFLNEQLDRTLARKVELMRALARMPARS